MRILAAGAAAGLIALAAWLLLSGEGRRPSVLLITIDTLRADALTSEDTPSILGLPGVRFLRARTPIPLTLPAHLSLLTGLMPPEHGIRDNTAPPLPARERRPFTLLSEEFGEQGYVTAAFVAGSVLDPRYGLDGGFDTYQAPDQPKKGDPRYRSLDAAEQLERVSAWMEQRPKGKPFFLWVHLWEPHDPYRPYAGDDRRAGTAQRDPPRLRYAGEARKADAAVQQLLSLVDTASTVVVVTSDHGESLGEHGEATHGNLCYGATMDIPLILAGPGIPVGEENRQPCSLVDVAPTLRELCGLPPREGAGRHLLRLPDRRVILGESLFANRLHGWAQQTVATDGAFSLVDGGPRFELFDLKTDPAERTPLPDADQHPAYEALDRALLAYRARRAATWGGQPYGAAGPYGSQRRPVRDLLPASENRRLRDVRTQLPTLAVLNVFKLVIARRDKQAVRRLLADVKLLAAEDPANPAPCLELGRACLIVLGNPVAAVAWLEEAVKRGYRWLEHSRLMAEARRQRKLRAEEARRKRKKKPR